MLYNTVLYVCVLSIRIIHYTRPLAVSSNTLLPHCVLLLGKRKVKVGKVWFPWCSSSSPHQRHRQTHQPLRAFFTCPRDILGYLVHRHLSSTSALTFQVRKRVAVILREHLPDDLLPPPPIHTSLTESVQGNLVRNFLAQGG